MKRVWIAALAVAVFAVAIALSGGQGGWKTFFPLVDTAMLKPVSRPPVDRFTTVADVVEKRQADPAAV